MDLYDEIELKRKSKEVFDKQNAYSLKVLKITFISCGLFFLVLALILFLFIEEIEPVIALLCCGGVFLIIGLICLFIKNPKFDYDKYSKMFEKTGTINVYSLEARIKILEEEVERLNSKINKM